MIIYKVTNKINGKIYIGKTIQEFEKYKRSHINNAKRKHDVKTQKRPKALYSAIRKYGENNFVWEIIETCKNKIELNEREIYYIKFYNSFLGEGYNATKGGDGGTGEPYKRTDEIKHKISLSLKGHKRSKESIRKQIKTMSGENHPLYGIGHKKESIKKMSKSKLGRNNPAVKKYWIKFPTGEEKIIEDGLNIICKKYHLWRNAMYDVARGKKKSHKGWECKIIT